MKDKHKKQIGSITYSDRFDGSDKVVLVALDDFIANESGMKFQHLAVALGKLRWPGLVASERRADLGLDAYASALNSPDGVGRGLASSTTPTLKKIAADAENAKKHYGDLKALIFVTPDTVSRKKQEPWVKEISLHYSPVRAFPVAGVHLASARARGRDARLAADGGGDVGGCRRVPGA